MKELIEDINTINNNSEEINYYDLTGDLLTEYYESRDNKGNNNL